MLAQLYFGLKKYFAKKSPFFCHVSTQKSKHFFTANQKDFGPIVNDVIPLFSVHKFLKRIYEFLCFFQWKK